MKVPEIVEVDMEKSKSLARSRPVALEGPCPQEATVCRGEEERIGLGAHMGPQMALESMGDVTWKVDRPISGFGLRRTKRRALAREL